MSFKVLLEPEAIEDIADVVNWYEEQRLGLGSEFLAQVALILTELENNPNKYPVIISKTHRALLKRFPYGIFYIISDEIISITACLHCRRDPKNWD